MQKKYEVLGIVGEGAYGIVYKCQDKETKEYVAIKKFKESENELMKKTMKRELQVLQILKHENVVQFKEAFKRKSHLFLVFEYVDKNLLELLQEKTTGLSASIIKSLIYQLCKAIHYLHQQNVIHRDIKPENLLVNNNNQLKLCDFGFARQYSTEALTDYVATRWYRAPELLVANGEYGKEIDYWSIGCIMGELIDGIPLFPGDNEVDQLHCIQRVLGNLPPDQIDHFYKNPFYEGRKLLNITKPELLERRYLGKLSKQGIDLIKGLLELDPKKRYGTHEVLNHPYFDELNKRAPLSVSPVNEERGYGSKMNKGNNSKHNQTLVESDTDSMRKTMNINIVNFNTFIKDPISHGNSLVPGMTSKQDEPHFNKIKEVFSQNKIKTPIKPIKLSKIPSNLNSTIKNNINQNNHNMSDMNISANDSNTTIQNKSLKPNVSMTSLLAYKTFFNDQNEKNTFNYYFPKKYKPKVDGCSSSIINGSLKMPLIPNNNAENTSDIINEKDEYKKPIVNQKKSTKRLHHNNKGSNSMIQLGITYQKITKVPRNKHHSNNKRIELPFLKNQPIYNKYEKKHKSTIDL